MESPILLIEDNEDEILLTKAALNKLDVPNKLEVARDGEEGLNKLLDPMKSYSIAFLDLRMSRVSGKQVLRQLNKNNYCQCPVVCLSTSNDEQDINQCYELNANSYIRKPLSFSQFLDTMKATLEYWLQTNKVVSS